MSRNSGQDNPAPRYEEVMGGRPTTAPAPAAAASVEDDTIPPPAYIHTVYDETYRGIWHSRLAIMSVAHLTHIIGNLESCAPSSDGSFGICIAGGTGNFVSKALWESLPKDQRPALDTEDAGREVSTLFEPMTTLGSVLFPFLITNAQGERMRYVLRAYVLPSLLIPMFISFPGDGTSVVESMSLGILGDRRPVFEFKCRDTFCTVVGVPAPDRTFGRPRE